MANIDLHAPGTLRWKSQASVVACALTVAAATALTGAGHASQRSAASATAHTSLSSSKWGDDKADKAAKDGKGKNTATLDPGSLYTIDTAIGARSVWAQTDSAKRQITGQGVTVALLDSGTARVPGLAGPGKLTYGPDLSVESNGVLTNTDSYGHGTHMAGIIAARDPATLTAKTIPGLDPAVQLGVAPDAELLSLKLANRDGSTDVSEVIAALNWVTEHQVSQDGSRVRVINLSFGTASIQPYQLDPLAAAAENAWRHGLVVVVSGGNDGQNAGQLVDPAIDPYVIAVGASSSGDTVGGWGGPAVAPFSSSGNASRHVDLLAPGTSIASLRDPGSYVDVNHPEGLVSGDTTGRLFRGSGTSQATAVTSGAIALLLQAYPTLTPDQVKALLIASATHVTADAIHAGAGQLNVASALDLAKKVAGFKGASAYAARYVQQFPISTGQGSLDAARGGGGIVDAQGVPLIGEVDAQGNAWNPAAWWAASSTGTSWSGGQWLGVQWTGDGWDTTVSGLLSARWRSANWVSARWRDADWASARWRDAGWASARWRDAGWADGVWG